MTALAILGGCLLVAGSIIAHALLRGRSATEPTPAPAPTPAPQTFDEHAATALALMRPDDPALPDADAAAIAAAVEQAIDNYASYLVAVRTGLDPVTCELLIEQTYSDLREDLTPPQLARALVSGLHPHAAERAAHLTDTDRLHISDLESPR